ncbi:MAG: FAD-dependent oxidoreductase [Proteobacteria bacterium]|nr:MAG: FAD-dependent oxidoreductase [Pseudomonadota bacterium]
MSKVPSQSGVHPWAAGEWPEFLTLNNDLSTDVLVIGAGIAGLTTAYQLAKNGTRVVVIDASQPGDGETGNTSAHLSSALDEHFQELEGMFGEDGSRLAAKSHRYAIDAIQAICEQEGIDCQFERVNGYLFASSEKDNNLIRKEFEAASRAGFTGLTMDSKTPFAGFFDALTLTFPQQAQFQPLLYLQGLTRALKKMSVPIYTYCEAVEFVGGEALKIHTADKHEITARDVVVATNTPMNNRFAIHTKQGPYRTYVCEFAMDRGAIPKGLYWDSEDPYHYIRTQEVNDHQSVLIVGGEDHKVGQDDKAEDRWEKLQAWTRKNIPQAGALVKKWSGQVNEPNDGLAFIGRNPGDDHVYIVTGDSGHGLTHGTIAGFLITDLIAGRDNPWEKLYSPSRVNRHTESMKEFFKENVNVALQYKDYFTPGDVSKLDDIAMGEGAVVRHGLRKIAAYRDHNNQLHCNSAVCPHLGGIVHWNGAEKTWDCPCHGSRFDIEGHVVNGPSVSGLKPAFEIKNLK